MHQIVEGIRPALEWEVLVPLTPLEVGFKEPALKDLIPLVHRKGMVGKHSSGMQMHRCGLFLSRILITANSVI